MKKLLLLISFFFAINTFAQTTLIPDPNFEQYLIDFGYDTVLDGEVITENINTMTTLNIGGSWINFITYPPAYYVTDLTGIEDFSALTYLDCNSQSLLASLDISQNVALTNLNCSACQLSILDVSSNVSLEYLACAVNNLSTLDISSNVSLNALYCSVNSLTNLDLSQNILLEIFNCKNTNLTSLDLSNNTALWSCSCYNNNLTCLNLKNGNNTNFATLGVSNNPNLTCIEVDDATWSNNNWTGIDAQMYFSNFCSNECTTDLTELINTSKQLLKIVDLMGRETTSQKNKVLIYIYSDGTTERVFEFE